MKHYLSLKWNLGQPIGQNPTDSNSLFSYKIVKDPYKKRITVEKYHNFKYLTTIYDSGAFDFRKLAAPEQKVWEREERTNECLIRDEDDRVILLEKYSFYQNLCRSVELYTPQGILIGRQQMFYSKLQDPFDGAILYDLEGHPVFWKKYALDSEGSNWSHVTAQGWGEMTTI